MLGGYGAPPSPPARQKRRMPAWGWALSGVAVVVIVGLIVTISVLSFRGGTNPTETPIAGGDSGDVRLDATTELVTTPSVALNPEAWNPTGVTLDDGYRSELFISDDESCQGFVNTYEDLKLSGGSDRDASDEIVQRMVSKGLKVTDGPSTVEVRNAAGGSIELLAVTFSGGKLPQWTGTHMFAGSDNGIQLVVVCKDENKLSQAADSFVESASVTIDTK